MLRAIAKKRVSTTKKPSLLFLAYVAHKNFEVFWMDVKCMFLNWELEETVYVEQPPGFFNWSIPINATF